jgi:hypothetical protein
MRTRLESIVKSLYQDIFDTGNCPAVDPHYHKDVVCYFNGLELTLNNLKASMAKFVSLHEDIKTEIKDLLIDGERTFARLERSATCRATKIRKTIDLMVLKEFKDEKIIKLWFMVDDELYKNIWSERNNSSEILCTN